MIAENLSIPPPWFSETACTYDESGFRRPQGEKQQPENPEPVITRTWLLFRPREVGTNDRGRGAPAVPPESE